MALLLSLLLLAAPGPAQEPLPEDVAAAHPEGKWQIRKRDFYGYLARFNGKNPLAKMGLEDYLRQRLIQAEAAKHQVSVTDRDVARWTEKLDAKVREESGGDMNLERLLAQQEMTPGEMKRRARLAILREEVARRIFLGKDPSWPKDKELPEESVVLVIDKLYQEAPKELDPATLPEGVVARVGASDVTEYEYGRELSFALPATEVGRALNEMILTEQVRGLLGNDDPPSEADLEAQKEWFLALERNRLERQLRGQQKVTDAMIEEWLKTRGLTFEQVYSNPAFLAQARARGHFRRSVDEKELLDYYGQNKDKYGAQVRVARILVAARAQPVVAPGRKVRSLEQGKALADAIWLRATEGADFGDLARESSDDPDVIKRDGGVVPIWITAATTGYEDTFAHAAELQPGGISKPWFSAGRGYVIAKLLERKDAPEFDGMRQKILADAAEQKYRSWQAKALRDARKSESLLEDA
jgi:hypothetical protein